MKGCGRSSRVWTMRKMLGKVHCNAAGTARSGHSLLGVSPAYRPPEMGEWPNDLGILPCRRPPHPQRGSPPWADATPFTCGAPGMRNALGLLLEDAVLSIRQNVTQEGALLTQDVRV